MKGKLIFIGTGTSAGVPFLNCDCEPCHSEDHRDRRTRCSSLIQFGPTNILIDCGPDIRRQILKYKISHVDCVLVTHNHADHINGFDDLAPIIKEKPIPVYCLDYVGDTIVDRFPDLFNGKSPKFIRKNVEGQFVFNSIPIIPIRYKHGKLTITGYRFGNFSYITDCKRFLPESYELLKGTEILVINTLEENVHPTHLSHSETFDEIITIQPKRAYTVHMTHGYYHEDLQNFFNENLNMEKDIEINVAYDGLQIDGIVIQPVE